MIELQPSLVQVGRRRRSGRRRGWCAGGNCRAWPFDAPDTNRAQKKWLCAGAHSRALPRARDFAMPTTRAVRRRGGTPAPRAAGGRAGPRALPAYARHDIAAVAPTCRALRAAKIAQVEPFSGEVVTLSGHVGEWRGSGARRPRHHRSFDHTIKIWRDGACERTIQAHSDIGAWQCCRAGRASSTGGRLHRETVDIDALERTFKGSFVWASRRCPTACTLRSAPARSSAVPRRRDARPHLRGTHT